MRVLLLSGYTCKRVLDNDNGTPKKVNMQDFYGAEYLKKLVKIMK